jgi:predicted protein tyrosine phosphatase
MIGVMRRVLFICEGNLHRSPTAEDLYRGLSGLEVRSAGLSDLARTQVTEDLLEWADMIFVMEKRLAKLITRRFGTTAFRPKIISLEIPDDYQRGEPALESLLQERLKPYLGTIANPTDRGAG